MGRSKRPKTKNLAKKLKQIRTELSLTFEETIEKLNCPHISLYPASIYEYEKDKREPPLEILLQYSRLANVYVEALIDDNLELPRKLPAKKKSLGLKKTKPITE